MPTPHAHHAIGVFGGTFDPIHLAHLRLAEELADTLGLAEVRFVPAGKPPHRAAPRTAAWHRLAMTRLAVAGNPRFTVEAREIERTGPSYTVDTLAELRAELGAATPLWLLLGADAFLGLADWHDWQRLFDLANIAVAARPGARVLTPASLPGALQNAVAGRLEATGSAGAVRFLTMTPLAIASSDLRAARVRGDNIRYLVPDAVLDYIEEHSLYPHA